MVAEISITANTSRRKYCVIQTAFGYSSTVLQPTGVNEAHVMVHLTVFQIMIINNIKYFSIIKYYYYYYYYYYNGDDDDNNNNNNNNDKPTCYSTA